MDISGDSVTTCGATVKIGDRFGKLTVVEFSGFDKHGAILVNCVCDCDRKSKTRGLRQLITHQRKGKISACRISCINPLKGTPGDRGRWADILQRCYNPNNAAFVHYGGRGIRVADKWLTFEGFYEDMGSWPEGMSIERIDVNGNYEPGNVKWATDYEQSRNKRNNRAFEIDGVRMTAKDIAIKYNIIYSTLMYRLDNGIPIDVAIEMSSAKLYEFRGELVPLGHIGEHTGIAIHKIIKCMRENDLTPALAVQKLAANGERKSPRIRERKGRKRFWPSRLLSC